MGTYKHVDQNCMERVFLKKCFFRVSFCLGKNVTSLKVEGSSNLFRFVDSKFWDSSAKMFYNFTFVAVDVIRTFFFVCLFVSG